MARGLQGERLRAIGGETAEMPGFYAEDDYDIAGFIVGVVDREHVIDGKTVEATS